MQTAASFGSDIYSALHYLDAAVGTDRWDTTVQQALTAGSPDALPALCCIDVRSNAKIADFDVPSETFEIFRMLKGCLFGEDKTALGPFARDKLRRLGISIQLAAMLRTGSSYSVNALVGEWNKAVGMASKVDDEFLAEAFWIEQYISGSHASPPITCPSGNTDYSVTTKFVTVSTAAERKGNPGSLNTLTVTLYRKPKGMPAMRWGFVRNPQSFSFFLDDPKEPFSVAFQNSYLYLKTLGIWPDDLIVEWNIKPPESLPGLSGASAGGAIAIATGNILARYEKANETQSAGK